MAGHPLRPATHCRLGRPLPYQLANRPRAHLKAIALSTPSSFTGRCLPVNTSGISPPLGRLSPTSRKITHVLRTRSPLYSLPEGSFLVRLACMKHTVSVRPEPGSNSPLTSFFTLSKLIKSQLTRPGLKRGLTRHSHYYCQRTFRLQSIQVKITIKPVSVNIFSLFSNFNLRTNSNSLLIPLLKLFSCT